jgi:RHS repeat-associated protein
LSASGPKAYTNPFWFSSQAYDPDTGFLQYLYRVYVPELQRWPNQDPIGESGGNNLYRFVHNSPINRTDPLGLFVSANPDDAARLGDVYRSAYQDFNAWKEDCEKKMLLAETLADRKQRELNGSYTCCVNGKWTTPNDAMPGNGLGHKLTGYYAKEGGASKTCLAAANAWHEGVKEFWPLKEWSPYPTDDPRSVAFFWVTALTAAHGLAPSQPQPYSWAWDTARDIWHTYDGYKKDSPESCLPKNCKKK